MLAAGADDAALLVVVATAATTASMLDANHAAYVASTGTRRPSSSSSATHAELLLCRRHTPSSTAPATHAAERITLGRIDTRSTAAVPPLATTHRPTHGLTTSPRLRQRHHAAGHWRPRTAAHAAGQRACRTRAHHAHAMSRSSKPPHATAHAMHRACACAHMPPSATRSTSRASRPAACCSASRGSTGRCAADRLPSSEPSS